MQKTSLGLCLALGLPAIALIESHVRHDLNALQAAVLLTLTPWLLLLWVKFAERRPMSSIGLHRPGWPTAVYGLVGILVNVGISVAIGSLAAKLGMPETESDFPRQLIVGGYGWALVVFAAGGAVMTEIAFRGYALARLDELTRSRWIAAGIQIALTGALFVLSRPGHALVWVADDAVFTAFYLWRRDTSACLIAHIVPNSLASALVALQLVQ